jgi:hypothetical protein
MISCLLTASLLVISDPASGWNARREPTGTTAPKTLAHNYIVQTALAWLEAKGIAIPHIGPEEIANIHYGLWYADHVHAGPPEAHDSPVSQITDDFWGHIFNSDSDSCSTGDYYVRTSYQLDPNWFMEVNWSTPPWASGVEAYSADNLFHYFNDTDIVLHGLAWYKEAWEGNPIAEDISISAADYGVVLFRLAKAFWPENQWSPHLIADLDFFGVEETGNIVMDNPCGNQHIRADIPSVWLGGNPFICTGSSSEVLDKCDPSTGGQPTWPIWVADESEIAYPGDPQEKKDAFHQILMATNPEKSRRASAIYLGWALHMLGDLSVRHHVYNMVGDDTADSHTHWEDRADSILEPSTLENLMDESQYFMGPTTADDGVYFMDLEQALFQYSTILNSDQRCSALKAAVGATGIGVDQVYESMVDRMHEIAELMLPYVVIPPPSRDMQIAVALNEAVKRTIVLLACFDTGDWDGDGIKDWNDNCPKNYNPRQLNCNGDDIGDACDPVPCVAFVDYGVNGQVCLGANNFVIWTGTPQTIRIETRAAAGVVVSEDGSPAQLTEHDVQVRWCDCSDYLDVDVCTFYNCIQIPDDVAYYPQWTHSGWHMASLNTTKDPSGLQYTIGDPAPAKPLTTNCRRWHPEDTEQEKKWSEWGLDSQVTGLWAQHCSPDRPLFGDNDGQSAFAHGEGHPEERWWDWRNELWWRKPYSKFFGQFLPNQAFKTMQPPGYGFLWVRPEVENWSTEANKNRDKYLRFDLYETRGKPNPILKKSWPGLFSDLPIDDVIDPVLEQPIPGLVAVLPADVSRLGAFAYDPADVAPGSALGGLALVEVDRSGANLRDLGRSVAAAAGAAPSTVGFASAAVRLPALPGGGDDAPLAAGTGGGPGLAIFGGTLASGSAVNTLWLGRKKGQDEDGTAVWEFALAPSRGEAAPAPRSEAGLVFDWERGRLLLFGGLLGGGTTAADCWSYGLAEGQWSQLPVPRDLPGLRGFETVLAGRTAYLLGGFDANGARNGEVLAVDLDGERAARVVGRLADGPGARSGLAVTAWGGPGDLRLVVQGGVDEAGVPRSDAWELDPASGEWERVVEDCAGSRCPPSSAWPLLWSSADGESLLLVPTSGDPASADVFWVSVGGGRWRSNSEVLKPPTTMDCDGDGANETGTGQACTSGSGWWAGVGRMTCGSPGGDLVCSAPPPGAAAEIARWSPTGWEWMLDVEVREDGFAFAVTDSSLLVFDLDALAAGAAFEPVAEVDLVVPGSCPWCGGPDFAFDVELAGDRVLVAAVAGLHAFDASSPAAPTETGFLPGRGPVLDVEVLGDVAYLADGAGVTAAALDAGGGLNEIGRLPLGAPVLGVEVSREEWLLWALLPARIRAFELLPDPRTPVAKGQAVVAGLLSPRMKADGRWAYVSGLTNRAFFATAEGGVEARGSHAVRSWVEGRERHGDLAVRVDLLFNRLEVWQEVAP